MRKFSRLPVYILCLLAMVFWSLSYLWYKEVYLYFTPFATVFYRLAISSVLVFSTAFLFKKLQKVKQEDWVKFLFLAFFEPFLYFIGESQGMKYISPTAASVIISIIPLIVPVAAYFFLKERLLIKNIVGIVLSCVGVVMVALNGNYEFSLSLQGVLLLLISVLAAVCYSIFLKILADSYNPFTLIAWQNTIGAVMFFPLVFIFERDSLDVSLFTINSAIPLFKLALFASSLAFMFYSYSVRRLGAIKANIFTNLIPVITAFCSFLLLDEKLLTHNILGIIIVISGLVLSQLNPVSMIKNVMRKGN